jgi:hypothetical protein
MNRLYETVKKIRGIEYVYMGFGRMLKYVHPKDDQSKIDEGNILHLLDYLDQNERNDLSLYEEDRTKLVSLLSEAEQEKYLTKRTAELQTRRRHEVKPITLTGVTVDQSTDITKNVSLVAIPDATYKPEKSWPSILRDHLLRFLDAQGVILYMTPTFI